ncbi:hypothetical protein ABZ924_30575 [Streptomyces sp. NPDC046876]|uniref:hypothetical protein n=1 Tax=Streptomyces sp. NPDC046876 TaxID=3155616 RepID=UPI0033E2186B
MGDTAARAGRKQKQTDTDTGTRRSLGAAALPAVAAVLTFGWAWWGLAGGSPLPSPVALVGGAVLVLGSAIAYFVLAGGSGGLFGALLLAAGLLLTVTAADQSAARPDEALCVVRAIDAREQASYGEGAPPGRTVYRHELQCPGGDPGEIKTDHHIAEVGGEVRIAHDRRHRVSPVVAGTNSPWTPAAWAVAVLALSTVIGGWRRPRP